jgi:UDP-galactopyranose mutase
MRYCIVGAGFSGAVVGRALSEAGHKVLVIDERPHVAGNCHCHRDPETGVMTHVYGPHIFHTSDERVWTYVQKFGVMRPYLHRVQAISGGLVYSLPLNLLTINQFFRKVMGPEEAQRFVASKTRRIPEPANFEEQALSMIGKELYTAFFRGYTRKQWGLDPTQLPASILKRLPLRYSYDDSYFSHRYQAIPEKGYTEIVATILNTPNLELRCGVRFEDLTESFEHVVYTGPIDRYFNYELGRLGYRTLDFETFRRKGDYQGAAVINYCDEDTPYTRITEHKHFAPWERDQLEGTILYREFSRPCGPQDIPYYPIRQTDEEEMLRKYVDRATATSGVSFIGRLGSYRYLDMDVTIGEALSAAETMLECIAKRSKIPVFFVPPLRPQHPGPRAPQGSKTEREAPRSRPATRATISLQ